MNYIQRSFYERQTAVVAQELIGMVLVREYKGIILSGIITETEAYGGHDDPASHAFKSKTPRNGAMFGPVGHAYVYVSYGLHHCFNVVAYDQSIGAGGVLIRAIKPLDGIETMKVLRKNISDHVLANGPGKLTQALNITKNEYGVDLTIKGSLFIITPPMRLAMLIKTTPRIGISAAKEVLWRYII